MPPLGENPERFELWFILPKGDMPLYAEYNTKHKSIVPYYLCSAYLYNKQNQMIRCLCLMVLTPSRQNARTPPLSLSLSLFLSLLGM